MANRKTTRLGPRKQPQQARSRETKLVIIEAAARVFVAHGYAGGTTNRIAATAGVSVGSLYEYYPNKDAILVALVEAHLDEAEALLLDLWAHVPSTDVRADAGNEPRPLIRALVRRFVSAMVRLHARDPNLHRVIFEEAPLPRALRERLFDAERRAATALTAILAASAGVTDRDPAIAARVLVTTVEALTHAFVIHPAGAPDEGRYVEEIAELVIRYLGA